MFIAISICWRKFFSINLELHAAPKKQTAQTITDICHFMRFRKFDVSKPNPWEYPSRYPYIILEGPGRPLSANEVGQIKVKRESWRPSRIAHDLNILLKNNIGKTVQFQLQNPGNYYDNFDELPKPFIAEIKDVVVERVLDFDIEFDQLFIFLSNLTLLNGEGVFKEYNYDYETLLKLQENKQYKLNFNAVTNFSIEQVSFWKKLFVKKNVS